MTIQIPEIAEKKIAGWLEKDFNVDAMIQAINKTEADRDSGSYKVEYEGSGEKATSFEYAKDLIEQHFARIHEKDKNPKAEKNRWTELQHGANIGIPECVELFKTEIDKYIRANNLTFDYPKYYASPVDALFDETFGFGCWNLWNSAKYRESSQSSFIYGEDVYFDIGGSFIRQPFRYQSEKQVENLAHQLKRINNRAELSTAKPSLEINMHDGTRVSIFIPPLVNKPLIMFRNPIVKKTNMEEMAVQHGTIDVRAIELFRLLARLRANMLIVGAIRTGKTTFLKAFFDARQTKELVVSIENSFPELYLNTHYPDSLVSEFAVPENEMDDMFPKLLRIEHEYLIVAEMRYMEIELFLTSTERGKRGTMGTYHTSRVKDIPQQLARLVTNRFPNRSFLVEYARIAESLDVVLTMKRYSDNTIKCVAITELRLDQDTYQISAHDIMRYNEVSRQWEYKVDLSDQLIESFRGVSRDETTLFLEKLKELEQQSPLTNNVQKSAKLII